MGNVIDLDNAFDEVNLVFILDLLVRGFSKLVTKEAASMEKTSVGTSANSQSSDGGKSKVQNLREDEVEILQENPAPVFGRSKSSLPSFKKNKRARHKSPVSKV